MMRSAACLGAAVLLLAGCETVRRTAWEAGLPGSAATFQVDSVDERVGYLDTRLSSGDIRRRIFAPLDDADCKRLLVPGRAVQWAHTEPYGPVYDEQSRCRVVGLGDLEGWRDSRGRITTSTRPITSSRTRYAIVYRDEEYLYAQGGFSIVGLLGWRPGSDQAIALLPRTEECAGADRNGFATVEYRVAGRPAFAVVTERGLCPISGILPAEVRALDFPSEE